MKPGGRKKLLVMIVVAVIVIAILGTLVFFYTANGSLSVSTPQTFADAGTSLTFNAQVTAPPLLSAGALNWNFGDGGTLANAAINVSHTYAFPGKFFAYAESPMSNGKVASNANQLISIQVVQPSVVESRYGSMSAYGVIAVNQTTSSLGAPLITVGGTIAIKASIQQEPTFYFAGTNSTWQVVKLKVDWGDGANPVVNTTLNPFKPDPSNPGGSPINETVYSHVYSAGGLFALTVSVTTQNYTDMNPVSGTSNTITTSVGQTIAVGPYSIPTYTVQNPGIIVNMEQEVGGYSSLDPAIDYESVGYEIIANVYETLITYNGVSTSSFVPVIASDLPTWTQDNLNYTFHIRSNLKFSNGDPVTAWDVKYSITRTMLFNAGSPGTPGWIVSQFLVPGISVPSPVDAANYSILYNAIEVDNATQNVTFHLAVAAPPLLFEQVMADPLGCAIVDPAWFDGGNNPKLVWSPAGFTAYENYSYLDSYVPAWTNGAVGSGPWKILYENNPNVVVLVPNPDFTPVPGVPAASPTVQKVVIEYIQSAATRELSLQSGQADIAGIPSDQYNVVLDMISKSLVKTLFFPTLNLFWWWFNYDTLYTGGKNKYGNTVPSDFFMDINMRRAFAHAFNFQQYFSQIIGNDIYHVTFAAPFGGSIPKGMIGYQNLSYYNQFNLALAQSEFKNTSWYKTHTSNPGFTLAINVEAADTVNQAAAAAWAANIETFAPGINVKIVPTPFADEVADTAAWANPEALSFSGWLPDYPFPTDYTQPIIQPSTGAIGDQSSANGGYYPNAYNWNIPLFQADPNGTAQVANLTKIYNWIQDTLTVNSTNTPEIVNESDQAQMLAMNMSLFVPGYQQYAFFVYRTWINGMENEVNPILGGVDWLYDLLSKQTASTATTTLSTSATQDWRGWLSSMPDPITWLGALAIGLSARPGWNLASNRPGRSRRSRDARTTALTTESEHETHADSWNLPEPPRGPS